MHSPVQGWPELFAPVLGYRRGLRRLSVGARQVVCAGEPLLERLVAFGDRFEPVLVRLAQVIEASALSVLSVAGGVEVVGLLVLLRLHAAHCTPGPGRSGVGSRGYTSGMSRIETGIVSYTLSADYYASVGADFDTEAVDDAILAQLNRMVPVGVTVERSGRVLSDEDIAEVARKIDWPALLKRIDVEQILADHAR
jgi:hypothetical protein